MKTKVTDKSFFFFNFYFVSELVREQLIYYRRVNWFTFLLTYFIGLVPVQYINIDSSYYTNCLVINFIYETQNEFDWPWKIEKKTFYFRLSYSMWKKVLLHFCFVYHIIQ